MIDLTPFETKYIKYLIHPEFNPPLRKRKTLYINVVKGTNTLIGLGYIQWYGAWRQYVFYPNQHTLYNKECLRSIANACEALTKAHKEQKKC